MTAYLRTVLGVWIKTKIHHVPFEGVKCFCTMMDNTSTNKCQKYPKKIRHIRPLLSRFFQRKYHLPSDMRDRIDPVNKSLYNAVLKYSINI